MTAGDPLYKGKIPVLGAHERLDANYSQKDYTRQMDDMKRAADEMMKSARKSGSRDEMIVANATKELFDNENDTYLQAISQLKRFPVTIDEFIESKEFLGGTDYAVWPTIREELRLMNPDVLAGEQPVKEAYLAGATNTAKTARGLITNLYQLYLLTCFDRPQSMFSLSPQTPVVFMFQAVSLDIADKVIYRPFRDMFTNMAYTRKWVDYDKYKESELHIEGNVECYPRLPNVEQMIGQAIISGIMDECFVAGTKIDTPNGQVEIQDLKAGDRVYGFGVNGVVEDTVIAAKRTGTRPVYQVEIEGGVVLHVTGNHPFATADGWVSAKDLKTGDTVHGLRPERTHAEAGGSLQFQPRETRKGSSGEYRTRKRQGYAYAGGSFQDGGNSTPKFNSYGSYQGQAIAFPYQGDAGAFCGRKDTVYVNETGRATQVLPIPFRSAVHSYAGSRPYGSVVQIRSGTCAVGRTQEYDCGFSSDVYGWDISGGGQDGLCRSQGFGEVIGGEELCASQWHDVHSLNGRRVISVSPAPVAVMPVYNIETGRTHSYFVEGVGVHNCNFYSVITQSKLAPGSNGEGGYYDQAQIAYNTISRRRENRFQTKGVSIGCLVFSSSIRYQNDFLDRRIDTATAKNEEHRHISRAKMYDIVWPRERIATERFKLLVGRKEYGTRILEDFEKEGVHYPKDAQIEMVPMNYKPQFLEDAEGALRDVIGIASDTITPFIAKREKIYEAFEAAEARGMEPYVLKQNVDLLYDGMPVIDPNKLPDDRRTLRYVHVDLSYAKDKCGIAVVKPAGHVNVHSEDGIMERLPYFEVELALSIKPHANKELEIADVRQWIVNLQEMHGIPIACVSYDGFESKESRQLLKRAGMNSRYVSVDRTMEPYQDLKRVLYQGRIAICKNDILATELSNLEYLAKKDKVDHPPKGAKDIADAVAGAVHTASQSRTIRSQSTVSGRTHERVRSKKVVRRSFHERKTPVDN